MKICWIFWVRTFHLAVVPATTNLSGVATSGDFVMEQSPPKSLLKEAVVYLQEKVTHIEDEAETYVRRKIKEAKSDNFEKADSSLAVSRLVSRNLLPISRK